MRDTVLSREACRGIRCPFFAVTIPSCFSFSPSFLSRHKCPFVPSPCCLCTAPLPAPHSSYPSGLLSFLSMSVLSPHVLHPLLSPLFL